jgi:hypothetical protein
MFRKKMSNLCSFQEFKELKSWMNDLIKTYESEMCRQWPYSSYDKQCASHLNSTNTKKFFIALKI